RGTLQSQIDDIWVSSAIALDFSIPEMVDPIDITDKDFWIEFVQYIETEGKKLKNKIVTIEGTLHLNKTWDTWLRIVKIAANNADLNQQDYLQNKNNANIGFSLLTVEDLTVDKKATIEKLKE
ncbi:27789_t:CDS:2, partial [Gigaspora margarita]